MQRMPARAPALSAACQPTEQQGGALGGAAERGIVQQAAERVGAQAEQRGAAERRQRGAGHTI